jgi:hypothetical protein
MKSIILESVPQSHRIVTHQVGTNSEKKNVGMSSIFLRKIIFNSSQPISFFKDIFKLSFILTTTIFSVMQTARSSIFFTSLEFTNERGSSYPPQPGVCSWAPIHLHGVGQGVPQAQLRHSLVDTSSLSPRKLWCYPVTWLRGR